MKHWLAKNRLAFTLLFLLSAAYLYKNSQGVVPATAVPVATTQVTLAETVELNSPEINPPELNSVDFTSTEVDTESLLKENFELAARASDGDRQAYAEFLSRLDAMPDTAREMISEGLARTPRESAIVRAGLLELVARFANGQEKWAAGVLEKELVENPSARRISRKEAKTRAEKEQAIAITPDILRTQMAYENLASVLKTDCRALEQATTKIMMEQKDEILVRGFESRLRSQCPTSHLSLNQD